MDLFRLGLRNLMGVLLPGALLVLVLIYVVFSGAFAVGLHLQSSILDRWSSLIALFLVSYLVGSLMRLNSADKVDQKWARYSQKELRGTGKSQEEFRKELEEAWAALKADPEAVKCPDESSADAIWRTDQFPYPVWHFYKLRLYHPNEAYRFFWGYRNCMRSYEGAGKIGKEFFNYCKTVIHHSSRQQGDALVLEIQTAEALVRFYAGTYYALVVGKWMLAALLIWQGLFFAAKEGLVPQSSRIVLTALLIVAAYVMQQMIVKRFRGLRLKEVDTVFDAFYLTHRHAASCPECALSDLRPADEKYKARENLLNDAFMMSRERGDGPTAISLDCLVSLMKERSGEKNFLSSIYFAGAEGDHPYFLKNERVAVGLSVLPEDRAKTEITKRHPKQQEVIFVLSGALLLELEQRGGVISEELETGTMRLIEKGQCHRISPINNQDAIFLFVKTNPAEEPREEPCQL